MHFVTSARFVARSLAIFALGWSSLSLTAYATDGVSERLHLEGTWRFALDREDIGLREKWFTDDLRDRIELPGVLQAQGFGDEISADTPWVLGLGGEWWKLQPEELRSAFSQPGRVEVPFLSQPPRHFLGAAWYQRDIEIPAEWNNRRTQLVLERPRWESTVWIDEHQVGSMRSLVAPHEFDFGVLEPGHHRLTIRLDNRMIVSDPKGNNGHMPDAHAVSDALGSTWNGVAGKIELRCTPQVWLSDVQAFPNVADKSVRMKVKVGNITGETGRGQLIVGGVETEVVWQVGGGEAEVVVPLGEDAATWDEFNPQLHRLRAVLQSPLGEHSQEVTFGLREITWRGKEPLINGRVVNFRTTHFGNDFPLTGYPATDVESWQRIIRRCQEFGLNGIRFHSCCPPEAAFTAADELGFYLQAECGLWSPFYTDGVFTSYLEEETELLLRAYGNHPSFVLFSPSNEPSGRYTEVTPQWAKRWYERDPRRLYAAGTGWNRPEQVTGGAQFAGLVRYGRGELRNTTGWFGNDHRTALEGIEIPVLAHEIGQWCAYPDFDVIEKFTGYLRPSNYHIFRYIAERNGVADINDQLAWASGKFQLACYKEELEANLRTPGLAGHQMLDIRDYLGQGTALIGVLDAFWDPKSYVSGEEFRRFHSPTVPLARLRQRTFTTSDTLDAEVAIYHFGARPLVSAKPYWKIVNADGTTVRNGVWDTCDVPIGKDIPLGKVNTVLHSLPAPRAYKLVVGLEGGEIENDWNFWLYPKESSAPTPAGVLVAQDWQEATERLEDGGTVLFVPGPKDLDPTRSPPMKKTPVFWNIQMTVRPPRRPEPRFDAMLGLLCDSEHPALANFPTDKHCDWQWTSIVDGVRSVNLTSMPQDLQPIVSAIDDWNRNWRLGVLFECRVGHGRLLVSAIPLDNADPVTLQLRESLLTYAAGEASLPLATLTRDQADSLWGMESPGGTAPAAQQFDPDLDDGTGPANAK
ncbi:Beta-glucuronidase [Planctomycetes bacterium CA13]|uniref:Beta-glucuronidase n=2 Tax=Novipirellula herctigrandis TaxID=2527986 RepID=A0A5C5ZCJ9_9BACT|nr:Beta-glucuronidase [Planctomycetes bacterium CA13]